MAAPSNINNSWKVWLLAAPPYLVQVLYWGWLLALFALADPDSCWLLGTGREIAASGLAYFHTGDPFSWSLVAFPSQYYVPYQWLTALVFSSLEGVGGVVSLLFFTCAATFLSFVYFPQFVARHVGSSFWLTTLALVLSFNAGLVHFLLRPELVSYLFLSLLMAVSMLVARADKRLPEALPFIGSILLFTIWANCHTGFVLGLVFLFASLIASGNAARRTFTLLLAGGILGSLFQPFGSGLYRYLPHLFFAPINKLIQELMPLPPTYLIAEDYRPFAGLLLFAAIIVMRKLTGDRQFLRSQPLSLVLLVFALLMVILAFSCQRLIGFASIALSYLLVCFLAPSDKQQGQAEGTNVGRRSIVLDLALLFVPLSAMFFATAFGARAIEATVPNPTRTFRVPYRAIDFIDKQRPAGRLLNDAQFGDVLIYKLGKRAQVFMDTRFDLYSDKLTQDYFVMSNAQANWRELLDEYKIDWVFYTEQDNIVRHLRADKTNWQEVLKDDGACILVRKKHE